jgi:hypothetical protein
MDTSALDYASATREGGAMTMHQIPAPMPPDNLLARAVSYDGDANLVGLYWAPGIDEAMITDGRVTFDGHFLGYLDYIRHSLVAPILWQWNLGSSEDEATHWLLLDRAAGTLSVAPRAEAERLLREQWPPAAEQPVKAWTDADLHAFMAQQIASIDPAAGRRPGRGHHLAGAARARGVAARSGAALGGFAGRAGERLRLPPDGRQDHD